MSSEVEDLLRRLKEQQDLLEEQRRRYEEEKRLRRDAEGRLSKTNLPTFLDGLHRHLYLGLEVQEDETQSTRGDPANATNKLRPRKIKAWDSFAMEQEEVWRLLMESSLVEDKLFTSLHTLEEMGETVRRQLVGSELDLNHFLRQTVEDHVSKIIEQLYKDPILREVFALKGSIRFENHANTLSPEREIEESMQNMDLHGRPDGRPAGRRRSPRLAAREESESHDTTRLPKTPPPIKSKRPRADQFCVYNIPSESSESSHRVAAYIKEYKSPHKVTLGHIYEGLEDMDVDQVVEQKEEETPKERFRRAIAGLLTQPFDYMIRAGTQRAVFSTGQADIYLRTDHDPSILYYYLSVPKGDAGLTTGWDSHSDVPNRLHLTAVGQSLAFTLQALKLRPQSQAWRLQATNSLPKWEVVVADILDSIPIEDMPSSEYRPSPTNEFIRISPIRLRRRRLRPSVSGCQQFDTQKNDDNDHFDPPDTPSRNPQITRNLRRRPPPSTAHTPPMPAERRPTSQENYRRYCTLACLRGLVRRGVLDQACPNAVDHGTTHHTIDSSMFLNLLRLQLAKTINADCEVLGIHGSRGAVLKVTLSSHGYTVPAKCTVAEFVKDLKHEAAVYERLRPIQGVNVPLYLGSIDLTHPYSYDGIAYLEYMMLLSPGGKSLGQVLTDANRACLTAKTKESLSAMHRLGVLHRDPAPRNLLYNLESKNVVVLDFERAELIESRVVLGIISPNRKRKRTPSHGVDKQLPETGFAEELNRAIHDIQSLNVQVRIH